MREAPRPGDPGDADLDATAGERLVSRTPLVVRRRVCWGECDPAGVVYTPRFADYLACAWLWFSRIVLGDTLVLDDGSRLATPMKALSLDFHRVLRPEDLFDMTVSVSEIRTRTFDLFIVGRAADGDLRFAGRLSPIVVATGFASTPLPPRARAALLAYQQACAAGAPGTP